MNQQQRLGKLEQAKKSIFDVLNDIENKELTETEESALSSSFSEIENLVEEYGLMGDVEDGEGEEDEG